MDDDKMNAPHHAAKAADVVAHRGDDHDTITHNALASRPGDAPATAIDVLAARKRVEAEQRAAILADLRAKKAKRPCREGPRVDFDLRAKIRRLHGQGMTFAQIGRALDLPHQLVRYHAVLARAEPYRLPARPADDASSSEAADPEPRA